MKIYTGPKRAIHSKEIVAPSEHRDQVNKYNVVTKPSNPPVVEKIGILPQSVVSFSGYAVPKFQKLMSEGWIIQNPMSKTSQYHYANDGSDESYSFWSGSPAKYDRHETTCRFPVLQGAFSRLDLKPDRVSQIARARDEAITRVFAKAQTGNADLLIDISQFKSLIKMLSKAGQLLIALSKRPETFLDIVRASRDGRRYVRVPPDGKRVPVDSLSGLWCEIRFGWGPLLGTLNGIVEAVQRTDLDKTQRFTYRAEEEINFNDEATTTWYESYSSGGLVFTNQPWFVQEEEFQWRSRFRAGILLEHSISLSEALGLRTGAIPIAAWDLVPYSFIVDRFFNIGNWIRSLNPIPASVFGGSWITEHYESSYNYRGSGVAYDRSGGSGSSYRRVQFAPYTSADYKIESSGYVRRLVGRPPTLPVLRHDWADLKSLFNLLDVLFLAIQRLKPVSRRQG